MVLELSGLIVVNLAYAFVGTAAFLSAGWVTDDPWTWRRLGASYLFGLVLLVVPASYLALLGLPVGLTASAIGVAVLIFGAWRVRRLAWPGLPKIRRPTMDAAVGAGLGAVTLILLVYATRAFLVRPLIDWDSWAIWAVKARLLYQDHSAAPAALRSGLYGQTPYPLGLPTLQALGFGAMGRFDGTLIGAQFIGLAYGFAAALWSLLDRRARPTAIGLTVLAILAAPQILYQLITHYADVPLGLFVGLGVAAGAAWTSRPDDDHWLLACFVAFLAMAGLTKSEGLLFAAAGAVALVAAQVGPSWRPRARSALIAVGALAAVLLPWRIYCSAYGLTTPDYDLGNALRPDYLHMHSGRLHPVLHELWHQLDTTQNWGWLVLATGLGLSAGLLRRRWRVSVFASVWLALASGGLVLTYWISTLPTENNLTNSSFRTIVSLLIGATVLLPLLIAPLGQGDATRQ